MHKIEYMLFIKEEVADTVHDNPQHLPVFLILQRGGWSVEGGPEAGGPQ